MIYKDVKAPYDTEECPEARPNEACLNCGEFWEEHHNWGCPVEGPLSWSETSWDRRYETQSMRDSLSAAVPIIVAQQKPKHKKTLTFVTQKSVTKAETDLSDWRAWRNQAPGECPCGIVKSMCDYHR